MDIMNCTECGFKVNDPSCHCSEKALFAEAQTMIGGPGKFEGEGVETAYFYLRLQDGDGESLYSSDNGDGCTDLLDVNEFERALFDFKPEITHFIVAQDSQGFVSGKELTDKQTEAEREFAESLMEEPESGHSRDNAASNY